MRLIHSSMLMLVSATLLAACGTPSTPIVPTRTFPTHTSVPATPTRVQVPTRTPIPTVKAELFTPGQHGYSFETSNGTQVRYLLYAPADYDAAAKWPLIVFLHGSGETGSNLEQLRSGAYMPHYLDSKNDLPFLVVSPQLPQGEWGDFVPALEELLTHLEETLPVDTSREYLTGLSWGGFGTWAYALQYPDRFAAIAPIAGGYILGSSKVPEDICRLKDLPVWVFHGEKDRNVKPFQAQTMVAALSHCGGDVKFTLYPNDDHVETWLDAYTDPKLYEWFLAHTK